jgi:hypothetical protein
MGTHDGLGTARFRTRPASTTEIPVKEVNINLPLRDKEAMKYNNTTYNCYRYLRPSANRNSAARPLSIARHEPVAEGLGPP